MIAYKQFLKILPIIFFLPVLQMLVHGTEKITIGIAPVTADGKVSSKSDAAAAALTSKLGSYSFIALAERSGLKSVMDEIAFNLSGFVDEASAVKAGKLHGVQAMIIADMTGGPLSARVVHVETSRIIAAASGTEYTAVAEKLARCIEIFIARERLKTMRNDSKDITLRFAVEKSSPGTRGITISDRGSMRIGDSIVFTFSADKAGYVTIVDIQPNGDVVLLYPNDFSENNKVTAGKTYRIPSIDDGFDIKVTEPEGTDTLIAFFTTAPVEWLDKKKLSGEGFKTVQESSPLVMTRGFAVVGTGLTQASWESAVIEILVER